MVDVRTETWDYLYRNGPTSLDTIASSLGQIRQTIEIEKTWANHHPSERHERRRCQSKNQSELFGICSVRKGVALYTIP